MDIFGILTLIGGLALFLYGMNVMGEGLEKISGGRLERVLEKLTSNPLKAVGLGALVTAVIQSSSATTVMVVGFVNSGIMKLSQAIGIIMGANIGTTFTAWLLSLTGIKGDNLFLQLLKPSSFSPVLALIGIFLFLSKKNNHRKDVGEIMLGFSVLMYGMEAMSGAVEPLADVPEFTNILTMFQNPILGIAVGALLTAVIQSSSASVGILQALSVTGAFTYGSAIPIIMGQNIGTCVTAMISSMGASRNAKRTAFVHLYFNIIGTILFMTIYFGCNAIFHFSFTGETANAAGIAMIHSIFNIFAVAVLLPFTRQLEKLAYLTLPITEEEKQSTPEVLVRLDERFLTKPTFAMEQCVDVIKEMARLAQINFIDSAGLLCDFSEEKAEKILKREDVVDMYDDKISSYLAKLNSSPLNYKDSQNVAILMRVTNDFERISDRAINMVRITRKIAKSDHEFTEQAREELARYKAAVEDILHRAIDAFVDHDLTLAQTVEPLEAVVDQIDKVVRRHHMKRLKHGTCTMDLGLNLADVATNFERVADHCSNVAIYLIQEEQGKLIGTHNYATMVKEENNDAFVQLYKQFWVRYVQPIES
ncbi:MAG: Na/Pi cotransporter family protein [Lachnospiraceae bacterium]